jgi:hypothetical protein
MELYLLRRGTCEATGRRCSRGGTGRVCLQPAAAPDEAARGHAGTGQGLLRWAARDLAHGALSLNGISGVFQSTHSAVHGCLFFLHMRFSHSCVRKIRWVLKHSSTREIQHMKGIDALIKSKVV